jgi:hypothetical protein
MAYYIYEFAFITLPVKNTLITKIVNLHFGTALLSYIVALFCFRLNGIMLYSDLIPKYIVYASEEVRC